MTAEEKLKELITKVKKRAKGKHGERKKDISDNFYPGPGADDWHTPIGEPSPGAGGRSDPWA